MTIPLDAETAFQKNLTPKHGKSSGHIRGTRNIPKHTLMISVVLAL
jgi:3-mercaptopyruvate sulfurtransferase SseA